MQHSQLFILDDAPADFRPLVQVMDNFARNHRLGVIFEGRVGNGQLLVCGFDLPHLTNAPAAQQFLSSLYAYVGSAKFKPATPLDMGLLENFFMPKFTNKFQALGAKIHADSEAAEHAAELAMDGDPLTMWHTPWDEPAPDFPHELVLELPRSVKFAGITCLPRQDNNHNGWIKDYAVFASADGRNWGTPVAAGAFKRSAQLQTVKFAQTVEARYLKLVAKSSHDPTAPFASLAELDLIPAE